MQSLIAAFSLVLVSASAPGESLSLEDLGTWTNKSRSVQVQITPCGENERCGTVVWANAKAKSDAARGGTPELVGTQMLRKFRDKGGDVWKGKAFVADIGKEFSGTIRPREESTTEGKGWSTGGLNNEAQNRTRVTQTV